MYMRAYQIEEKLDRLEMAVEALRNEVEGIKSDIRKAHAADGQADGQAAGAAAGEAPKKRTRKKAEG